MERPCLALEFLLRDLYGEQDEQSLKVFAQGDSFCGELEIWDDHRKLEGLCSAFGEIPAVGVTQFTLGIGNKLRLSLQSAGRTGHHLLTATLSTEFEGPPSASEELTIALRCDPASLDSFFASIRRAQPGQHAEAILFGRRAGQ